ncbi:hypothetical protein [Mucilaginibacter sp. SP1R1]|uniref:hypothetical protein n=1 Tax=Mucilaginibacter sp. SP1R1 TaxID=2723091 RepID=UPI001607C637|nr:hypothetical protein [Mucilaginibacter sp. SP1R1]MBB6148826.1 hypothetical protein [Mucilaginibacter sp. SP1R1]
MPLVEWISVIANILSILGFILTIKSSRLKDILVNPYAKVFGASLIFTIIVFCFPWDKFHYGDIKPIVIHDTILAISKPNLLKPVTKSNAGINNIKNYRSLPTEGISKKTLAPHDTALKKIIQAKQTVEFKAPVSNSPMQFGDNNVQNNGRMDHHPDLRDVEGILHYFPVKDRKITLIFQTTDPDSKNYCVELKSILTLHGYKNVELFDHLLIGAPEPPNKIMLDTANYQINVQWN